MKKELYQEIEIHEEGLAYGIIADFMNKYEQQILPNLKKRKLDEIKFLLCDVILRSEDILKLTIPLKEPGAYTRYRFAIQELNGFIHTKGIGDKTFELCLNSLDRHTAELDFILQHNPHYSKNRKEIKK